MGAVTRLNLGTEDGDDSWVCHVETADPADVQFLLKQGSHDDGRGPWEWMRFPNGDLALICWPHGDTYEILSEKLSV